MEVETFKEAWLSDLWRPEENTGKFDGGQITIIGGSKLFHGAPILALQAASRCVSMVYFSSPLEDQGIAEKIKAEISSFIYVPREEVDSYIAKSQAALIGPGLMRNHFEEEGFVCDNEGRETRDLTLRLLESHKDKKWVVDGGSLQVIDVRDLPPGAVITPNRKEYEMLFDEKLSEDLEDLTEQIYRKAKAYGIIIVHKGEVSVVSDGRRVVKITGGARGVGKGGTGDVIAGLTVGLLAKNETILAASCASYLVKKAAEKLSQTQDFMFNSDDLAVRVARVYSETITNNNRK